MANVFHRDFTLNNNHALHARDYPDIAARDADTVFNTDAANIGKAVLINSPASVYTLLATTPLFLELSNVTSGNVTTSDTLIATQLLLGNADVDIITEPDLTYSAGVFTIGGTSTLINSTDVRIRDNNIVLGNVTTPTDITADGGGIIVLGDTNHSLTFDDGSNVWQLTDGITTSFIGTNFVFRHMVSFSEWNVDGIDLVANNAYALDGADVLGHSGGVVTLANINQLDLTTQLNIENAMTGLANLTSIQSLTIALADAGTDAIFGWSDSGNTYRNLTPAEAIAIIGGGGNVTTSDTLTATQLLLGNGGTDIVTESKLLFDGSSFNIDISGSFPTVGTFADNLVIQENDHTGIAILSGNTSTSHILFGDTDNVDRGRIQYDNNPDLLSIHTASTRRLSIDSIGMVGIGLNDAISRLHIQDNSTATGITQGLTIEQSGTGDALLQFLISGGLRWVVGIDNSDFDNFKIQSTPDLGTEAQLTITTSEHVGINKIAPETALHIRNPIEDDSISVLTLETETKGKVGFHVGDRNPEGNVTGDPGDIYCRDNGTASGLFIHKGASAATSIGWVEVITEIGVTYVATATNLTTDGQNVIGVTDTSAARTITLSTDDITDSSMIGRPIIIKDESGGAGTFNILVDTEGSETIDGSPSLSITANFGVVKVYSNGTNLFTE